MNCLLPTCKKTFEYSSEDKERLYCSFTCRTKHSSMLDSWLEKQKAKYDALNVIRTPENEPTFTIDYKPLSVNEAWQGKRFKTDKYKKYERDLLFILPKINIGNITGIYLEFGLSSLLADFDNPVKPFVDILQKKYGFNDRDINTATIKKIIMPKGKEYIKFRLF